MRSMCSRKATPSRLPRRPHTSGRIPAPPCLGSSSSPRAFYIERQRLPCERMPHFMVQQMSHDAGDGLSHEVARRRTFAIISHPDAGKTTLTEKLLLYAGAVELA